MAVDLQSETMNLLSESDLRRKQILLKLLEMLEKMAMSNSPDKDQAKAFKVFESHVKRGGTLLSHEIPVEDATLFGQILAVNKIPYVSSIVYNPETGKNVTVFTTRDIDSDAVNKAKDMYVAVQKAGLSELSMLEFTQIADGRDVDVYEGLDEAELQMFRHYMGKETIPYAVNETKEGKFDIFVQKEHTPVVDANLRRVAFDFSGNAGAEVKKEMDETLKQRHEFVERLLKNEPGKKLYAVDTKNPGRFICIDDTSFAMHSFQQIDEMRGDNIERTVIKDKNVEVQPKVKTHELERLVDQLYEPVILTEEEMSIVSSIEANGVAIPSYADAKQMVNEYMVLLNRVAGRVDKYKPKLIPALQMQAKQFTNLLHLPQEVISQAQTMVQEGKLQHTAIVGDTLSYAQEDKPLLEALLEATIYKGATGIEHIQRRMHYEGRGEMDVSNLSDEPVFLLNADAPDFVLRLDNEGLTIFDKGQRGAQFKRADYPTPAAFANQVDDMIHMFPNIVVLTREEFDSERKLDIVKERLPQTQNHEARSFLFENIDKEREEMVKGTTKQPTPRQIEAEKRHQLWGKVEYHVDKNAVSKINPEKTHQEWGKVEFKNDVAGHKVEEDRVVERPGRSTANSLSDTDLSH